MLPTFDVSCTTADLVGPGDASIGDPLPLGTRLPGSAMRRLTSSALILAALALPVAARADTNSYAMRTVGHTVHGVITSIDGKYGLTVRDGRADGESVTLHRGTIINPTGLQLEPGMQVTIAGHPDGSTFDADEIDAPAQYLEDQELARRATATFGPLFPPNGTFQTNGPSAEGGG
jgi:hypothetical protein